MTAASHSQAVREMSRSTKFEEVVLASMMVTTLDQYEVMAITPSPSQSWTANESWRSGRIRDMVTSVNRVRISEPCLILGRSLRCSKTAGRAG
jgi:hypothetical protein